MTTLTDLRDSVATDIRDPLYETFTTGQIDAFINAGVNEVSRIYPKEILDDIVPVAATYQYSTAVTQPFRLEWYRDGAFHRSIQKNEDEASAQGGWELWAGNLLLPKSIVDVAVPATDFWRLWGYGQRAQLLIGGQVLDADTDGEWGVRMYARWQAYQTLLAERALFKQWQATSNNSDISPTQLQQMVLVYSSAWDSQRNNLRRLRRV